MPLEAYENGVPESEFTRLIHAELSKEGTCGVAYNGMSFDHEFTRVLFYRNLRDPYAWAWKNGNTYWDTIELVRAAFLLHPDALKKWPKKENGRPSFQLESLSAANLTSEELEASHDALADTIRMWKVAKLIRERAPKLWDYALKLRYKDDVKKLRKRVQPILYVVGKIPTDRHCSTFLSNLLVSGRNANEDFAFDLFYDPSPLLKSYQQWTLEDRSAAWRAILSFKCNQSPFVCRWGYVGRLTELSLNDLLAKMQLNEAEVQDRHDRIQEFLAQESENPFAEYIQQREAESAHRFSFRQTDPDEAIYKGFISDQDRNLMNQVLREGPQFDWRAVQSDDPRVEPLIFRYLARNYPEIRDGSGKKLWEAYCRKRQLQDRQQRNITADQIFSYELRDSAEPWGRLNKSQINQLLDWQNRIREVLLLSPRQKAERLLQRSLDNPKARFREGQWETVDALVNAGSRVLLVQRTGWGKSMVYFLATRALRDQGRGPTLIISPLLALMRNQEVAAGRIKLRARIITGDNYKQWPEIEEGLSKDNVDLLLVSPERLSKKRFLSNVLGVVNFGLIVVDEAHCISDWGHDFRPDYRRIFGLLEKLPPNLPVLGTTATANDRAVEDIEQQLSNIQIQRGQLTRESLELQAIVLPDKTSRMAWLAEQIPNLAGTGIVYVLTKRDAKVVAAWLKSVDIDAQAYYAGMNDGNFENSDAYRRHIENLFLDNKVKVLVATTALGMGYDKPDVGFVIHYQAPSSAIAYYQQVGRAGRALPKAAGVLLSGKEDIDIIEYFRRKAFPDEDTVERVLAFVKNQNGVTVSTIKQGLNLTGNQINQVIKYLSVQAPSPIVEIEKTGWRRTHVEFTMDKEAIRRLTAQRVVEWNQLQGYIHTKDCRMAFLRRALSDSDIRDCNRCDNCTGTPPVNLKFSKRLVLRAEEFLKRSEFVIQPRVKIPFGACRGYGFQGVLPAHMRASEGYVLSRWADAGWGGLVKKGKSNGYFDNELVEAIAEMIIRWRPVPYPGWITCIPSARNPELVRSFSERLAKKLGLRFVDTLVATGKSKPQKEQHNSFHQCSNLDGAFSINGDRILTNPVFLIDDIVDSRWTFTIAAALLRQAGSGDVYPIALTSTENS